jgi:hypothetical protein
MCAVAEIPVEMAGAVEIGVGFGAAFERAGFVAAGPPGHEIGGEAREQRRPEGAALGAVADTHDIKTTATDQSVLAPAQPSGG